MTTNLLHNAVVHNLPDGGTVCVTASAVTGRRKRGSHRVASHAPAARPRMQVASMVLNA